MRRKEIGVRGREEQRISWIRRKEIGVRGREGVAFYIILRSWIVKRPKESIHINRNRSELLKGQRNIQTLANGVPIGKS